MKKILALLLLLAIFQTARATDYFIGDSTYYSIYDAQSTLGPNCEVVNGNYTLPGTDSLQMDSFWYDVRSVQASPTGDDTIWIGIRITSGVAAPGVASLICQITDTIADPDIHPGFHKATIGGVVKLKGGDVIAFCIGAPAADTTSYQIAVATNSATNYGCFQFSSPIRLTGFAPNFSCAGGSSWTGKKPYQMGVWCHTVTGGGPSPAGDRVILRP